MSHFKIIRVDGTEIVIQEKPTLKTIYRLIGCDCIDVVCLSKVRGVPDLVMMVDDTGMIDGKPVNPKATSLYHSICKPGTVFAIHGDVAIVNDKDFS